MIFKILGAFFERRKMMNRKQLIMAMVEKSQFSEEKNEKALDAIIEVIGEELASGGKVKLLGFGTFEVSERAARKGRNTQTGVEIELPASRSPKFRAGKELKAALRK